MSLESARLFVQEVHQNKEFSYKVRMIADNKELIDFAGKEGFDFIAEELKEVNQEYQKIKNRELSEEELSMVIGGTVGIFPPCMKGSINPFCD